jgi:hypothetical protein
VQNSPSFIYLLQVNVLTSQHQFQENLKKVDILKGEKITDPTNIQANHHENKTDNKTATS